MTGIIKVDTIQNNGGTTGLTIDSTGRVKKPNGIFVYAQLTTSNPLDSSHPFTTLSTNIRFDEVKVNRGSAYNATNGRFTAPVAGIYRIHANLLKSNTGTDTFFGIYKNGTDTLIRGYNAVADYAPVICEAFFDLSANDHLSVRLEAGEINMTAPTSGQYNHVLFELVG